MTPGELENALRHLRYVEGVSQDEMIEAVHRAYDDGPISDEQARLDRLRQSKG